MLCELSDQLSAGGQHNSAFYPQVPVCEVDAKVCAVSGRFIASTFQQGVSHQQQMANSASFLSKCTMEDVCQLTHFSEPSDTNSVSLNLNFNLNSLLVFNLK